MGFNKTSNIKVYKQTYSLSFSLLYMFKTLKKSFLGFQINKRRNDKITYNQKKKHKEYWALKKKESKDVPAVAVKLPTFMFLKKKKKTFFFFFIIKKEVLQISLDKKVV